MSWNIWKRTVGDMAPDPLSPLHARDTDMAPQGSTEGI